MHKQIATYVEKFLSPFLCGYRKGFNAQYALISLLEKWRVSLDKMGYGGALLMDLPKAFDTLNHDLLIAKLHAYGFKKSALLLLRSYLSNRWQRTKVNTSYSSWSELIFGVPKCSVLGRLLFNLYINDLFYIIKESDVCNYADDNTLHSCDTDLSNLMDNLEKAGEKAIRWFENNGLKLNSDKCHLLVSGHKYECMVCNVGDSKIIETHNVKLLGIHIDSGLTFNDHLHSICKKASSKLNALSRQCAILPYHKRKLLMQAFFNSQFLYCPLVWMFHSRKINTKINNLHYETSTFEELLNEDGSITVHYRNIHLLATEMFKVLKGLVPPFMSSIFANDQNLTAENVSSNTRFKSTFYSSGIPKTTNFGLETLKYLGPKVWDLVPVDIKSASSIAIFKNKIKHWVPINCPCRLCANYIPGLGFV